MTKKQTIIITALSCAAFILAILVAHRFWVRLDLTKNKAYSISQVSKNLYLDIPEPVNITYYLSDRLKSIHPIAGEIEDTLREYASYSKGRIRLAVKDPVKTGTAQMIEELGLQAMQVRNIEQDQASLATVYSGIVIEYLDRIDILPFLFDTATLEYDLTSRIRALAANTERQIGVIVGDSFRNWENDFRYLAVTLYGAGYRVRQIFPGDEIPDSLPALFVLGGVEDLDDAALYRIDRYIQTGGKVLFAVKGVFVDIEFGSLLARRQESLGLLEMLSLYGASVKPELVLDRNALYMQYQVRTQSGGVQRRIARYPLWIGVEREFGNPLHPLTSNFNGLDLFWASHIELNPPASVSAEYLFTTSAESWLQTDNYNTSPEVPYMLEVEALDTRGVKILGAAFTGVFPSQYKNFPKPQEDLPDMPESAKPSRLIVIGDVDFASNISAETDAMYNMDFLTRAADWLLNDDDIINIRSRQPQAGRLDKIQNLSRKAAAIRFAQILNVGIIPALVLACALILFLRRSRRNKYEV